MKLNPVLLLCLLALVRSQPEFAALFDFSVAKINGTDENKFCLYRNLLNDSDTVNLPSGKSVYGDGVAPLLRRFNISNDKTTAYTSAIVVFDNEFSTTRRVLIDYAMIDTFNYQVDCADDSLIVKFDLFGKFEQAFKLELSTAYTVMALAINFQTSGNNTISTVYYMDSNGIKKEATRNISNNNPNLCVANYIAYDHNVGNLYYVGLSHQEITKAVFEEWVRDFVNTQHKKAECANCKENMTCTANAHLRPVIMGMRQYECTCKEDSAVYQKNVSNIDCMKLAYGKMCGFGCGCACASIDPDMCFDNCTPGYNGTALGKNFFTCTAIPGDHKSFWFYIFVVTIPIFIVAYIAKVIIYIVYNNSAKPAPVRGEIGQDPKSYVFTGHNSPTASRIVTSGPGSPVPMHKKPGSAVPESEIDTYKPSLIKMEDEKEFNLGSSGRQSEIEKNDPNTCKVCGNVKDELKAVFKCRHAAVCQDCLRSIKRCPICGNNALLLK